MADLAEARALGYDEVLRAELGSVTAVRRGRGAGPTVLMDVHMDAVPVTEPGRWSRPPLPGELGDGSIWSRGSVGPGHKGRARLVVEAAGVPVYTSCPRAGRQHRLPHDATASRCCSGTRPWGKGAWIWWISRPSPTPTAPWYPTAAPPGSTAGWCAARPPTACSGSFAPLDGVSVRLLRSRLTCYTGEQLTEEVFHPCWVLPEDRETARLARRAVGQAGSFFHAPYCTNGSCRLRARIGATTVSCCRADWPG